MTLIERLLDAAPAAMMAYDTNNVIIHVNRQWRLTFGDDKPLEQIIGTQIEDYYPRSAIPAMNKRAQEVFNTGRPKDFDIAFSFPGGLRIFLVHTFPLYDGSQIVAAGMVATDITERRRQQARAAIERERSDRLEAIGELSAGVAHDFNNLLGIIDMYTVFARSDREDYTKFDSDMEQIEGAVKSGSDLVDSLLTFGRRRPGRRERLAVREVALAMVEMFSRTLNPNIRICATHDRGAPWIIVADRSQLERAFVNLVVNARDAMPDGGRLTINIKKIIENGFRFVKVSFTDTGEGMSEDVKQKVFEPFFTTKPKGKGSGLGLATVYGIVRSMGGTVKVESEVGSGTTFTLYLPAFDPVELEELVATDASLFARRASSSS